MDRTDSTNGAMEPDVAISVRNLVKEFEVGGGILSSRPRGVVSAVSGVSFDITRGTTLGLVGESGCGKSTTARCILRLIEPTSGSVVLRREIEGGDGSELIDITTADRQTLRRLRREMQIVFQDPYASLNPRMRIGEAIGEQLAVHTDLGRDKRRERVGELLEMVGLNPRYADRFPHEFSGGQRQRVGVARALSLHPSFVVCDEPVSALDVSIQAQVLNLLRELQEELSLTYLFIAHDLAVVRHISEQIAVMYLGKVVELADSERLFSQPLHHYTNALLSAAPLPDPVLEKQRTRILLEGEVPSPINPPSGCRFHPRCPVGRAQEICRTEEPRFEEKHPGHMAACHFPLA